MLNQGIKLQGESDQSDDLRRLSKPGKLPCGARYCHRCTEECGVIVNAYILRDMASESTDVVAIPEDERRTII